MTKKYRSPVLSVLLTSIFMSFMIIPIYYFASVMFQFSVDLTIIIALTILCFICFLYLNSITITVNEDEVIFYRITGKYKSIPMNAYSINSYIVKRRLNGLSVGSDYKITYKLDENDKLEKMVECNSFTKKVFESVMTEINTLRHETTCSNSPAYKESDTPSETNSSSIVDTRVYKIEKEKFLEKQAKLIKNLGFAFLVLLILTVICAILVYVNKELVFDELVNYIYALTITAAITTGIFFGFIGNLTQKKQFINKIPSEILLNATTLRIDDSQFNLSNITNMKITPASYITTPIRTMNFTYEGKKYKYQLDGFNQKTIFPEYSQFANQLHHYFIDKKQYIFDL